MLLESILTDTCLIFLDKCRQNYNMHHIFFKVLAGKVFINKDINIYIHLIQSFRSFAI